MATVLSFGMLLVIAGVTVYNHRHEQRFAWFTPEQITASRKTMVRADYRVKIERALGERIARWMRRAEIRLRIAVTRRDGPGNSAGSRT